MYLLIALFLLIPFVNVFGQTTPLRRGVLQTDLNANRYKLTNVVDVLDTNGVTLLGGGTNTDAFLLTAAGVSNKVLAPYNWVVSVPSTNSLLVSGAGDAWWDGTYVHSYNLGSLSVFTNLGATNFLVESTPAAYGGSKWFLSTSTNASYDEDWGYAGDTNSDPTLGVWVPDSANPPVPSFAWGGFTTNYIVTVQMTNNWTLFHPRILGLTATNVNGAGITNLHGTNVQPATINSNKLDAPTWLAATNVPVSAFADMKQSSNTFLLEKPYLLLSRPPNGICNWLDNNDDPGQTNIYGNPNSSGSNALVVLGLRQLAGRGFDWYRIDNGWYAGRVNGEMTVKSNKYPNGMAAFVSLAHSSNVLVDVTLAWGLESSIAQIPTDIRTLMRWGVDGITIVMDLSGSWPTQPTIDQLRQVARVAHQAIWDCNETVTLGATTNRYVPLTLSVNNGTQWRIPADLGVAANVLYVQGGVIFRKPHDIANWTRTNFMPLAWWIGPGHYVHANGYTPTFWYHNGSVGDTNIFRLWTEIVATVGAGVWTTASAVNGGSWLGAGATVEPYLTNAFFNSLQFDRANICGRVAYSNSFNEIWIRPLGSTNSGSNYVLFINSATNGTTNINLTSTLLGRPATEKQIVRDAWSGAVVTNFINALQFSIGQTNTAAYLVHPARWEYAGDGEAVQSGPVSSVGALSGYNFSSRSSASQIYSLYANGAGWGVLNSAAPLAWELSVSNVSGHVFIDSPASGTNPVLGTHQPFKLIASSVTITNPNQGSAVAALGIDASGLITSNSVPGGSGLSSPGITNTPVHLSNSRYTNSVGAPSRVLFEHQNPDDYFSIRLSQTNNNDIAELDMWPSYIELGIAGGTNTLFTIDPGSFTFNAPVTVQSLNPGAATAALGVTAAGALTTNSVPGGGAGATNAVSEIQTNGVTLGTAVTKLNLEAGTGLTVTGIMVGATATVGFAATGGGGATGMLTNQFTTNVVGTAVMGDVAFNTAATFGGTTISVGNGTGSKIQLETNGAATFAGGLASISSGGEMSGARLSVTGDLEVAAAGQSRFTGGKVIFDATTGLAHFGGGLIATNGVVQVGQGSLVISNDTVRTTFHEGGVPAQSLTSTSVWLRLPTYGDLSGSTNLNASALASGTVPAARLPLLTNSFVFDWDGGGAAVTNGATTVRYLKLGHTGTIIRATLNADQNGSAVVDLWKTNFTAYPPSVSGTITAAAKPTLSSTNWSTDATLTGWTKTFTAHDWYAARVDSASTVTTLHLTVDFTHAP